MLALIDGDLACFQAAVYMESHSDGIIDERLFEASCDLAHKKMVEWIAPVNCGLSAVYFSGSENFRKRLFTGYKANRDEDYKPVFLDRVKAKMSEWWDTRTVHGMEADDLLAYMATEPDSRVTIVSEDKDFAQIPGRFLHIRRTGVHELRVISEQEAHRNLAIQWLMGDTADGLSGIFRVGIKKATALVDAWPETSLKSLSLEVVQERGLQEYANHGVSEADALRQFYCIRLVRFGEWDYELHQPTYIPEDLYEIKRPLEGSNPANLQPAPERQGNDIRDMGADL